MKKLVYALFSVSVVLACDLVVQGQVRQASPEPRDPQRLRRRAGDDPASSPFKFEPYAPIKSAKPVAPARMRATVELRVVGAAEGDTLVIRNTAGQPVRLRLQGIDAPEKGQSFFREATVNLARLASGKTVLVEFDPRGKPDSDGRIVAKVYLDGDDVALSQVKAGFAWYLKDHKKMQSESDRYTYPEAEKESRDAGRGLWQERTPLEPWKYRKP